MGALDIQYASPAYLAARQELHARCSTNPYGFLRWLLDHVPEGTGRLVDVGSGHGTVWRQHRDRIPERLLLLDGSPGMLGAAQQALGEKVRYAVADAQSLPLRDASADVILCAHMLYHVPERARAISEMRRVLRPGGVLVCATNGQGHLDELAALATTFLDDFSMDRVHEAFSLENGAAQLGSSFTTVTVEAYPDSLMVADAELLAAAAVSLAPERLRMPFAGVVAACRRAIDDAGGALPITKSAGVFLAC